ncbi:MAG: DEAD/DEAH box helicase [Candidatus Micrarchaeota archaeon]|nr:DEAD/DEAH box helicase [Candidatus Micrarchaeota archaeon]MDE1848307.1 DEAD/DEAH box helicase [Candidatus Micrarchaeota archaeon]
MQHGVDARWYGLASVHELVDLSQVGFREYQFNIAKRIFAGHNTLVILPTGLGKTLIGILAIANVLSSGKKALVLAPTKPLAEQHHASLQQYLSIEKEKILLLTGSLGKSKRKELESFARVIIATPQTVANELKHANFDLSDFGIAVFDECHKAVGKYAYTYIADECDLKGVQMVGLTASPGSKREKIKALMNVLKIKQIEIRISTDPDVAKYVMPKYIHVVEVEKSQTINRIAAQIRPIAEDSLAKLRNMGLTQFRSFETMPKGRLIELGNMIGRIRADNFKFGALYQYVRLLNSIHAYDLLETQGLYAFSSYMDSLRAREKKGKAVQAFLDNPSVISAKRSCDEAIGQGEEHPKVFTLINILTQNKGKSAIVFVQYRSTIKMLVEKLTAFGFDARAFVGKKDGVTQAQQKQTIEEFREGKFKVLVSSSIGEEGLDIPSVDMVVFYEPIPSEIRNIQRKGRTGRLYSGEVYLLMAKSTKDQVYLMVSRQREKKMQEVVKSLQSGLAEKGREGPRQSTL